MNNIVNLLSVIGFEYDNTSFIPKHMHEEYYQMYITMKGTAHYKIDGRKYTAGDRQLMLIKPGQQHEMLAGKCSDYFVLDIKFNAVDKLINEKLMQLGNLLNTSESVRKIVLLLSEEAECKKSLFSMIMNTYMESIIYLILRDTVSMRNSVSINEMLNINYDKLGPCVRKTLHYIEGMVVTDPELNNLDYMSANIGYNKKYMCKCFIDEIGISISGYMKILKIDKAKELILFSNYSVKDIAKVIGLKSDSYFIRLFKAQTGTTPLKFKAAENNDITGISYSFRKL